MQKRVGTLVVLSSDSGKPLIGEMNKGPELLKRRATQMNYFYVRKKIKKLAKIED